MSNIKITDLKKYLTNMSKEELIIEITEIVKRYPDIKEYYTAKLDPKYEEIAFEKYKKLITNEFFPDRGFGKLRYSEVNKAIKNFSKICNNAILISKLMLYYAETGVDFTDTYGDIDGKFYDTILRAYDKALSYITENNLKEMFIEDADNIRQKTEHMGWGFSVNMDDVFYDYFYEDEDEEDVDYM